MEKGKSLALSLDDFRVLWNAGTIKLIMSTKGFSYTFMDLQTGLVHDIITLNPFGVTKVFVGTMLMELRRH